MSTNIRSSQGSFFLQSFVSNCFCSFSLCVSLTLHSLPDRFYELCLHHLSHPFPAFRDLLQSRVIYLTIGKPAFGHAFYLTSIHFRGKLQHVGNVGEQKIKFRPIRTREIAVSDCKTNDARSCTISGNIDQLHQVAETYNVFHNRTLSFHRWDSPSTVTHNL